MDFFAAQDDARRRTKWLLLWFVLAVLGVVASVDVLVWLLLFRGNPLMGVLPVLGMCSIFTAGLIMASSGFKLIQLREGGSVLAKDLGARRVDPHTTDVEERRLINVVEEMAIASGIPAPQVWMMDDEPGINAFAAGTEPSNAVIGVTRGCVQRLTRDELQGVVAHEFSHILNGDMKLNMRLIGFVFGLMVVAILGRGLVELLTRSRVRVSGDRDDGGKAILVLFLLGLGLLVLGSIGRFFGQMIQAAISRQREYLADASAVQFTRNPDGLSGALKKIGGLSYGSRLSSAKSVEASHMFFSSGGLFNFGLATHPPLKMRIWKIDPSWDGKWKKGDLHRMGGSEEKKTGWAAMPGVVVGLREAEKIADVNRTELWKGQSLHSHLDDEWMRAAHDRQEAQALVFGLLLAEDDQLRQGEISFLTKTAGTKGTQMALQWHGQAGDLHSARKIALIDVAIPTLRGLSLQEYERFLETTQWLIASDAKVDLFEFMLQKAVERHLESHFRLQGKGKIRYHRTNQLAEERNYLVNTMRLAARGEREVNLSRLNAVLRRYDQATSLVKKDLLVACAQQAARDRALTDREAELLRCIADAIGSPVPPFVESIPESQS